MWESEMIRVLVLVATERTVGRWRQRMAEQEMLTQISTTSLAGEMVLLIQDLDIRKELA
ncbi:hypothetical protein VB737_05745 [Synechococcus sp. BA-120 BA3]|nr:hypothetical protein [Synechococcus sp. BA-120 BA3]